MTAYGNGEWVKFISIEAWWLLAVYQGFYLQWGKSIGRMEELSDYLPIGLKKWLSYHSVHHSHHSRSLWIRTVIVTKGGEDVKNVTHHSISIHFIFIWVHAHYSVTSFCSSAMGPINGYAPPDRPCMNRTAQNKCNHETEECPNKEPTT